MANVNYSAKLGDLGLLINFYTASNMVLDPTQSQEHQAVYIDNVSHNQLVLTGDSFSYLGGLIIAGTITGVNFEDDAGHSLVNLTDGNYTVQDFATSFATNGVQGVIDTVFAGNDKITGSVNADILSGGAGNDTIRGGGDADTLFGDYGNDKLFGQSGKDTLWGSVGNDRMEGGSEADTFRFAKGTGHDTIVDFDLNGRDHDFLALDPSQPFTKVQHGDNLMLDFGDGDILTLLDVQKAEFNIHKYVHDL